MERKLLLLEDEEILGEMYIKKLSRSGYAVTWMRTAEEVQKNAPNLAVDVVIVDHGIRGQQLSGLDIIPLLRESLPQAKIIMLSNYSSAQLEKDSLESGADAYLLKINTPPQALIEYLEQFS